MLSTAHSSTLRAALRSRGNCMQSGGRDGGQGGSRVRQQRIAASAKTCPDDYDDFRHVLAIVAERTRAHHFLPSALAGGSSDPLTPSSNLRLTHEHLRGDWRACWRQSESDPPGSRNLTHLAAD